MAGSGPGGGWRALQASGGAAAVAWAAEVGAAGPTLASARWRSCRAQACRRLPAGMARQAILRLGSGGMRGVAPAEGAPPRSCQPERTVRVTELAAFDAERRTAPRGPAVAAAGCLRGDRRGAAVGDGSGLAATRGTAHGHRTAPVRTSRQEAASAAHCRRQGAAWPWWVMASNDGPVLAARTLRCTGQIWRQAQAFDIVVLGDGSPCSAGACYWRGATCARARQNLSGPLPTTCLRAPLALAGWLCRLAWRAGHGAQLFCW